MKTFTILITALLSSSSLAFAPSGAGTCGSSSRISSTLSMATADSDSSTTTASPKPNPVVKLAANGMSLLKPIFGAEAYLQAAVLGAIAKVDKDAVRSNIETLKKENDVLIYTYGLSPFSSEALSILDAYGCTYKKVELGLEWFLLGPEASETRVVLSQEVEGGATSLPKIFVGGKCIGGYAELASLVESGEFDEKLKKTTTSKKGGDIGVPNLFAGLFK